MKRGAIGWLLVVMQFLLLLVLILLPWREPTVLSIAVGLVLVIAGGTLGLVAGRHLGRALTPTPVPIAGAGLRTDGAYRFVRHPIYSAVLLMVLGYVIAVGSLWTAGGALVLLVFFVLKSRWEDGLLREQYGEEWTAWAAHTGALLPRRPAR